MAVQQAKPVWPRLLTASQPRSLTALEWACSSPPVLGKWLRRACRRCSALRLMGSGGGRARRGSGGSGALSQRGSTGLQAFGRSRRGSIPCLVVHPSSQVATHKSGRERERECVCERGREGERERQRDRERERERESVCVCVCACVCVCMCGKTVSGEKVCEQQQLDKCCLNDCCAPRKISVKKRDLDVSSITSSKDLSSARNSMEKSECAFVCGCVYI